MGRVWAWVAVLLAACSEPQLFAPYPDLGGSRSVVFLLSGPGGPEARAVDLGTRPVLELDAPFRKGQDGILYALGFVETLSALGLSSGEIASAPEPNRSVAPELVLQARYQGGELSDWAPVTPLPEAVAAFRLPRPSGCTPFEIQKIEALDGFAIRRPLALPDGRAIAMGPHGLALLDRDGQVLERSDPVIPEASAAGVSSDGKLFAVGTNIVARIEVDPLRYEVVATGSIAELPVKWVAVEPGEDPQVYAFSGTGAWTRVAPGPPAEVARIEIDGIDVAQGGIASLGPDDTVAATSGSAYVYRLRGGQVRTTGPPKLVIGFDAVVEHQGKAILAEVPGGDLIAYNGQTFTALPGKGQANVLDLAPFRSTYVATTKGGFIAEYVDGSSCLITHPDIREMMTISALGDGAVFSAINSEGRDTWWTLMPTD
jgi:hypothetical protein